MHSHLHSGQRPYGLLCNLKAVFLLILFANAPQSSAGRFRLSAQWCSISCCNQNVKENVVYL